MSDGETTPQTDDDFPEYNEIDARNAEAWLPADAFDPTAADFAAEDGCA